MLSRYPEQSDDIVWCEDYDDAIRLLNEDGIERVLALTGVQTIGKLREYWQKHTCWFRILPREESLLKAKEEGLASKILFTMKKEMILLS